MNSIKSTECAQCNYSVEYFVNAKTQLYCPICKNKIGSTSGGSYKIERI